MLFKPLYGVAATLLGGMLLSLPLRAQGGLKGEYYRGISFGQKVRTRVDSAINFDWANRAPLPELDWSYYSIRWTGGLRAPASGRYTFYCQVDDGIRLWVGKQLVIDEWHLTPYLYFEGKVNLVAGQTYPIRIDYFNDIHGGRINLRWERPDQPDRWFTWLSAPGETIPMTYLRPPSIPSPLSKESAIARKPLPAKPKRRITVPRWAAHTHPRPAVGSPPIENLSGSIPPTPLVTPLTVYFEQGSYILNSASLRQLDSVLVYWKMNPPVRIEVVGHADRIGDRALNRTLSEYRARVVIDYLSRQGIARNQLHGKWHGDNQLLTLDESPVLRFQNRRVLILSHYD